jgi:TctA family transporter
MAAAATFLSGTRAERLERDEEPAGRGERRQIMQPSQTGNSASASLINAL